MAELTPIQKAFSLKVVINSIIICLVVGTVLTAINQGDMMMKGAFPPLWKILLTYAVPFCVSTFGAWNMACAQERDRRDSSPD